MDKCPTVELGVSTTHLKKKERKREPMFSQSEDQRREEIAI